MLISVDMLINRANSTKLSTIKVSMFVLKRKNIIIVSVLIITALTFVFCFSALSTSQIGNANASKIKIVLDAGHGGIDGGVSGVRTGVKESELNLKVVKKLEKYLIDAGMVVILTRSSEAGLYGVASSSLKRKDMEKRRDIIESAKPDLVISIHMNKYSLSTRRGAQVFYKAEDEMGIKLANSVQSALNDMDKATRQYSALKGDYYILNCSNYPSIITECGFLSNPEDEALLINDQYQDELAYTIYKGIAGYLAQTAFNYNNV